MSKITITHRLVCRGATARFLALREAAVRLAIVQAQNGHEFKPSTALMAEMPVTQEPE